MGKRTSEFTDGQDTGKLLSKFFGVRLP